jgi:putative ABC transport system ATP-binding protein
MIKTKDLIKIFKTEEVETTALNKVNLEIADKEFVAIMGPSGCGKSTLLNILGLLDNPTSGDYYFYDNKVSKLKERQRTNLRKGNIEFVFQSFNLIDELNVYENIELPLLYLTMKSSERHRMVSEVMDRMQISQQGTWIPKMAKRL